MHMGTRHGPGRFCMQHLDFLVRISQNRGLGRTLDTSKIIQMHGFLWRTNCHYCSCLVHCSSKMSKSLKKKRGKEATSNFNICIFLYNRCYTQWWCLVAHFITNIETALGHSVVIFLKCVWLYNWSKSLILWFEALCNLTYSQYCMHLLQRDSRTHICSDWHALFSKHVDLCLLNEQ